MLPCAPNSDRRCAMRTAIITVVAVLFCLAADAPDAAKKDQEKLQGDWTLASGERDGQAFPEDFIKSLKRTITGDKYTVMRDDEVLAKGTYTLDPSKKPKAIDIKLENADQAVKGIYELEGDTFKLCYA